MRVVASIGYAKEPSPGRYTPTKLTESITKPTIEACFIHSSDNAAVVSSRLPEYFKQNGYRNPTDGKNGPFQFSLDTELPFFEFIHSDPRKLKNFNTFQSGNRTARGTWLDRFPVDKVFLGDFNPSVKRQSPVLVDMGGGTGRDVSAFLRRYPQVAGYLVLQDLPNTIDALDELDRGIMPMAHDLFEPQTIIGRNDAYMH